MLRRWRVGQIPLAARQVEHTPGHTPRKRPATGGVSAARLLTEHTLSLATRPGRCPRHDDSRGRERAARTASPWTAYGQPAKEPRRCWAFWRTSAGASDGHS